MAMNRKSPKKILEAKIRNAKRIAKKMKKAKAKAINVMEQEGISE
jgi:indole-3-glycerol phosphate synthase